MADQSIRVRLASRVLNPYLKRARRRHAHALRSWFSRASFLLGPPGRQG